MGVLNCFNALQHMNFNSCYRQPPSGVKNTEEKNERQQFLVLSFTGSTLWSGGMLDKVFKPKCLSSLRKNAKTTPHSNLPPLKLQEGLSIIYQLIYNISCTATYVSVATVTRTFPQLKLTYIGSTWEKFKGADFDLQNAKRSSSFPPDIPAFWGHYILHQMQ